MEIHLTLPQLLLILVRPFLVKSFLWSMSLDSCSLTATVATLAVWPGDCVEDQGLFAVNTSTIGAAA